MAWEMGIKPSNLTNFDFRVKYKDGSAGQYGVEASELIDGKEIKVKARVKDLFSSNWGHGFFKFHVCDYCDDVLAETADISIGDAWLPEYVNDPKGTNITTVRSLEMMKMIEEFKSELFLEEISAEKVVASQAGGFRHRREGLAYRLYLKDLNKQFRPVKRVKASSQLSNTRKKVYEYRIKLIDECDAAYDMAIAADDFSVFKKHMQPFIAKYEKLYMSGFKNRMRYYVLKVLKANPKLFGFMKAVKSRLH
jgi:coenzyme F420-reducing hydrogenase beta subunit